tara:strand:- start:172 stop:402 length:231 start_codon:yes stop_codon:yes gene_type:complete
VSATYPAYIIDVGAGADYTIFSIERTDPRNLGYQAAKKEAMDYAKKYLHPLQISHAMYIINSKKDFDKLIQRRLRR